MPQSSRSGSDVTLFKIIKKHCMQPCVITKSGVKKLNMQLFFSNMQYRIIMQVA